MKHLTIPLIAALLLLAACARSTCAQEEELNRRSPEEAAILSTIEAFVDAVTAGDRARLQQLIWVNETNEVQLRVRNLLLSLIEAQRKLQQAALQRYGVEGAVLGAQYQHTLTQADRDALTEAVIFFDDPIAMGADPGNVRVYAQNQPTPMHLRRGRDGQWRIVFDLFDGLLADDTRSRRYYITTILIERFEANLVAIEETEQRIRAGELASVGAAAGELRARLSAASDAYDKKRNDMVRVLR